MSLGDLGQGCRRWSSVSLGDGSGLSTRSRSDRYGHLLVICWHGCLPAPLPPASSVLDVGAKTPPHPGVWPGTPRVTRRVLVLRPILVPASSVPPTNLPRGWTCLLTGLAAGGAGPGTKWCPQGSRGCRVASVLTPEGRLGLEGRTRLRATSLSALSPALLCPSP